MIYPHVEQAMFLFSHYRDVVIRWKSRTILARLCHVTSLLQRHVIFATWQRCFQPIVKVVLFFATLAKCYHAGVEVMLLLSDDRNAAR